MTIEVSRVLNSQRALRNENRIGIIIEDKIRRFLMCFFWKKQQKGKGNQTRIESHLKMIVLPQLEILRFLF